MCVSKEHFVFCVYLWLQWVLTFIQSAKFLYFGVNYKPVFILYSGSGNYAHLYWIWTDDYSHEGTFNLNSLLFLQDGIGDANDIWQVQVPGAREGEEVLAVRSKVKLIHYHVKCALHSHDKKLPKWCVSLMSC